MLQRQRNLSTWTLPWSKMRGTTLKELQGLLIFDSEDTQFWRRGSRSAHPRVWTVICRHGAKMWKIFHLWTLDGFLMAWLPITEIPQTCSVKRRFKHSPLWICWTNCVWLCFPFYPSLSLVIWLIKQRFCRGNHSSQSCGLKIWGLCVRVCVRARRADSACAYECGGAMLKVSGAAPAPSGHEWRFHCSVGVDCSDAEPRCIWLAVLRGISPRASPRPTPITSPRRRGSRRLIQRHRLSWVRDACLGFALEVLAEVRMTGLKGHESCCGWSFDHNSRLQCPG